MFEAADSASGSTLAWRRPALEVGLLDELEVPTAVRARVEWSRHFPATPGLAQVPSVDGVYALFRNGRLVYYGSSKDGVRAVMKKRILAARQLGVLRPALSGLTVRVGRVKPLAGSRGLDRAKLLVGVERGLIRHALKSGRRLLNVQLTRPFTVGKGSVYVRHVGEQRKGGRGRKAAPKFLGAATMSRQAGLVLESDERLDPPGWRDR